MSEIPEAAIEAVREFPFWDYGMDEVDPRSEYAEWVLPLTTKILAAAEPALRAHIAGELERHGDKCLDSEEFRAGMYHAAAIVDGRARVGGADTGGGE